MNILFTSAGRRVSLMRRFRRALACCCGGGQILAADTDPTAPALYEADRAFLMPRVSDPSYVPTLLEICKAESVGVLIPLIDPELPILAEARDQFSEAGTTVLVSSLEAVRVADDKLATAQFFVTNGIPTARAFLGDELLNKTTDEITGKLRFPVIVKPRYGSSGLGVVKCEDLDELRFILARRINVIVQEFLRGYEVTIDVFGDGAGRVISFIPRKRLKVRGGEVERAITVDDEQFRDAVLKIGAAFMPYGPINVQCFVGEDGSVFTEINSRFGGGYPLADAAGAQFPEMVLDLVTDRPLQSRLGQYQRGLVMARYDDAIFVPEGGLVR